MTGPAPAPGIGATPAVRLRDVAPRFAFQSADATTEQKVELVDRLIAAGVPAIEVSSFVRPDLVPRLADADEVFARIHRRPGVSLECCVGNLTGLRRAIDAGAHKAWFLLSADEAFSVNNTGRTIDDALSTLEQMSEVAGTADITLGTYLIGAFGGPAGLPRTWTDLAPLGARLSALGVHDWILADSFGYAAPPQIQAMVKAATEITELGRLTVHIHDHRGMGLAGIAELARLGITNIDTALGGAGGHPARPAARGGGVCTEDAAAMLELMGIPTGLDLPALVEAATWLAEVVGVRSPGFLRHTGPVPRTAEDRRRDRPAFAWPTSTSSAP
ncbi:pyruvate carboxyltransferase [Rhodococcus sp. NPDC127593]|uniref:pyruvate carboxyltransferase n=2 Tax=unclassified Rhodococcus (in: high G+C Gram-positive bacteria) TaxID=192944 RepID=UPI00363175F7